MTGSTPAGGDVLQHHEGDTMTALCSAIRRELLLIQSSAGHLASLLDGDADLEALPGARLLCGLAEVGEDLGRLVEQAEVAVIGPEVPSE
jgi:hypothetical protein